MARRSSLGPFPKHFRWDEIISDVHKTAALEEVRKRFAQLTAEKSLLPSMHFIVQEVIASRSKEMHSAPEPRMPLKQPFLEKAFVRTMAEIEERPRFQQAAFENGSHNPWRSFDSSNGFIEIARIFFAVHLEELLIQMAEEGAFELQREKHVIFARDMTQILVAFTARWFSSCVRDKVPTGDVVQWYLRHCAGKIDLEFEREVDPQAVMLRSPKKIPEQLEFGLES